MGKISLKRREFMKGAAVSGVGLAALSGATASLSASRQNDPELRVPRKKLGATGEDIPILLMGCLQKFDPKYDRRLHRAFRMGIDYLDTAQGYARGQSHKTLAPFVKQVGRENIWITSKVNLKGSPDVKGYVTNLDICLRDLETDYLNLFFMHAVDSLRVLEPEFIKMGEDLKKRGKTKYFGFSCHGKLVPELLTRAAAVGGIDAIMFRYNFRQYGDMKLNKAIDAAKKAGIGLIAMKTQGSVPADQEEVVKFRSKNFTLEQAKMKAVWADERIDAAVSTMSNMQQLEDNVAAACSPMTLSMDEFVQLNRLAALTAPYYCHGCSQICESRIEGKLRIADTLRYLMYYEGYGDRDEARRLYRELPAEERCTEGIDLARAAEVCPQGIDIAGRLDRAKELLEA